MFSPWVIVAGSLLTAQILSPHALPITENTLISSGGLRKAINGSLLGSTSSSLSHPRVVSGGKLLVDTEDSENPSLLTSIPTFAPPAAIKKRGDDRDDVGINIPNPIFSIGIPSVRVIRRYVSDRLRRFLRRYPTAQDTNPLPPAPTDAIKPHKAPITDETVDFVNNAGHQTNANSADQKDNKVGFNETVSDIPPSGELAGSSSDAIQDMASPGIAPGAPLQSQDKSETAFKNFEGHSLSNSLGTISHAQFEIEDNGKKRRRRGGEKHEDRLRRRSPGPDDGGYRGRQLEDYEVPTIWNGEVDLDDLNWVEIQELDNWLDTLAYMQKHQAKIPSQVSSFTGRPTVSLNSTALNESSSSPPSMKSTTLALPPKSLAQTLRLKPHSSFHNKTHHGHRRDETSGGSDDRGIAKRLVEGRAAKSTRPLAQDGNLNLKRKDAYDPYLEPIDISDEAFDKFRKDNPTFFGNGWRKEKRVKVISDAGHPIEERDPVTPSWFAMLLSPSALLEKGETGPASVSSSLDQNDRKV